MIDLDEYRALKERAAAELLRSANAGIDTIIHCVDLLADAKHRQPGLSAVNRASGEAYIGALIGVAKTVDDFIGHKTAFESFLDPSMRFTRKFNEVGDRQERYYHDGYAHYPLEARGENGLIVSLRDFAEGASSLKETIDDFVLVGNAPLRVKCNGLYDMWYDAVSFHQQIPDGFSEEGQKLIEMRRVLDREAVYMEKLATSLKTFMFPPRGV